MGLPCFGSSGFPSRRQSRTGTHLDLRVDDIEEACRRVIELGGVRMEQNDLHEYDVVFRVMLDPEGNEFCLVCDAARDASRHR